MEERKKKPTLEQIRTFHFFDIPTLATLAGLETRTVYHALLRQPVFQRDAEKIVAALAQHIGLELSLENVDIVVWEEYQVLWVIRASSDAHGEENPTDAYHFVYARNQQHARDLARKWLEQVSHLSYRSYTACPNGFQIGCIFIPGYIQKEGCLLPVE
ncbi:hypothetical protein [Dictyobacter formicarum]|uniref:Uncharacterized protein n=1 Tax=Dictyobacter formicarum TaxID=2778368 RepID=A0ABQ3V921_9CHLR|nr:hypothetical protein [Dictyobacter formicarum]GHO82387.1 hypothetical protein KSZ_03930 [Dictyobacter formicarum]